MKPLANTLVGNVPDMSWKCPPDGDMSYKFPGKESDGRP